MKRLNSDSARQATVRWVKFNAVGALGILIQLGTLFVLTSWLRLGYLLATTLAVEAAILQNFFWHQRFTWADRQSYGSGKGLKQLLKFNLTTGLFSIAGNLVLMRLFVEVAGLQYVIANLLTIATCSIVNFAVSDLYVFREKFQGSTIPVVGNQQLP